MVMVCAHTYLSVCRDQARPLGVLLDHIPVLLLILGLGYY